MEGKPVSSQDEQQHVLSRTIASAGMRQMWEGLQRQVTSFRVYLKPVWRTGKPALAWRDHNKWIALLGSYTGIGLCDQNNTRLYFNIDSEMRQNGSERAGPSTPTDREILPLEKPLHLDVWCSNTMLWSQQQLWIVSVWEWVCVCVCETLPSFPAYCYFRLDKPQNETWEGTELHIKDQVPRLNTASALHFKTAACEKCILGIWPWHKMGQTCV